MWFGFVLLLIISSAGCGRPPGLHTQLEPRFPRDCAVMDSTLTAGGWGTPLAMKGKVTIDVKQYRVRGRFDMKSDAGGNFTFEFTSSAALGGLHEDVVISCFNDTLRVFDRERLAFYEAGQVDSLILDATGLDLDVTRFVGLVTGRIPPCSDFQSVTSSPSGGGWRMTGSYRGGDFETEFAGGRMVKACWPAVFAGRSQDRIQVTYEWNREPENGISLDELIIFLEGRRWRVKMRAD